MQSALAKVQLVIVVHGLFRNTVFQTIFQLPPQQPTQSFNTSAQQTVNANSNAQAQALIADWHAQRQNAYAQPKVRTVLRFSY